MSVFSHAELAYPAEGKLGWLATIDAAGMPHVVPLGVTTLIWTRSRLAGGTSPGPGSSS
ncbi:MAG: hypothetical protein ACLQFR_05840 [Streptosporangiaceae bacterium]